METTDIDNISLDSGTLFGDVRDVLLGHIKALPKPWPQMSQSEQEDAIERACSLSRDLIKRVVHIVASDGRHTIVANLDKVTIKDGIQAQVTLSKADPNRHILIDCTGQAVLIVLADATDFDGQKEEALADLDQPSLPIDTLDGDWNGDKLNS
ncbi:MAG: hypothetical protein K2Q12_08160 [Rickettsiales bacterium]|nr:hypothetical protein [Rickettsiales bacterium]